jgi:hypothetical protein
MFIWCVCVYDVCVSVEMILTITEEKRRKPKQDVIMFEYVCMYVCIGTDKILLFDVLMFSCAVQTTRYRIQKA